MDTQLKMLRNARSMTLKLLDSLKAEQLNKIPEGFNNNIIWNAAHMVAAMQSICYRLSGLEMLIGMDFYESYKPGTKPEKVVDEKDIEHIKQLFSTTVDKLEEDYKKGAFANFTPFTTRYGLPIDSIEEAISFLPFHEGVHLGYIMALRRVVTK